MASATHNVNFSRHEQGFEVFGLRNDDIEISLVPELGAKIISLINRRTGREWMWAPGAERKLFRNEPSDDFASSTLIGWDECLPTIAPCQWNERELSDHGEVWSLPWTIDREALGRGQLKTAVKLRISPLEFERTIELHNNVVQLRYQLTNRSALPEKYLWAMHALAPVFPGDTLVLTAEARKLLGNPAWLAGMNLESVEPACVKTYAGPLREGLGAIANSATGDRLSFRWDAQLNDTLGVWLTRGGWHGHHHVALEPSNGCPDDLTTAQTQGRCGIIPAHGKLNWKVTMTIDPGGKS